MIQLYKLKYLRACFAVLILTSASAINAKEPLPDCTFPDAPDVAAPGWICDRDTKGVEVFAVGFAEKSGMSVSFMKKMAEAGAREQLAQRMRMHVSAMIKNHVETTGMVDAEQASSDLALMNALIIKETMASAKVFDEAQSPAGGVYIMLAVDPKLVKQAVSQQFTDTRD